MREIYEDGLKLIDTSRMNIGQDLADRMLTCLLEGLKQHIFVLRYLHLASDKSVDDAVKCLKWLEEDNLSWRDNFEEALEKVDYALDSDTYQLFQDLDVLEFDVLMNKLEANASSPAHKGHSSIIKHHEVKRDHLKGKLTQKQFRSVSQDLDVVKQGLEAPNRDLLEMDSGECFEIKVDDLIKLEQMEELANYEEDELLDDNPLKSSHGPVEDANSLNRACKCAFCGKGFRNPGRLNDHINIHTWEKPYKCDICDQRFRASSCLKVHADRHSLGQFVCDVCRAMFHTRESLRNHYRTVTHKTKADSASKMRPELSLDTSPQKGIRTSRRVSGRIAKQLFSNSQFNDEVVNGSFRCDICLETFGTDPKLKQHRASAHHMSSMSHQERQDDDASGLSDPSKPPVSDREVVQFSNVMFRVEGDEASSPAQRTHKEATKAAAFIDDANGLKCPYCGRNFTRKNRFQAHVNIHTGEMPFKCDTCTKHFHSFERLRRHEDNHSLRKFSCNRCDKECNTRDGLQSHKRQVHGKREENKVGDNTMSKEKTTSPPDGEDNTEAAARVDGESNKPHECQICGKGFRNKSKLMDHSNIHKGSKPHKCDLCQKYFHSKDSLRKHKEYHTVEKFSCDDCDKVYSTKDSLGKHKRVAHQGRQSVRPAAGLRDVDDDDERQVFDACINDDDDLFSRSPKSIFVESSQESNPKEKFSTKALDAKVESSNINASLVVHPHPHQMDVENSQGEEIIQLVELCLESTLKGDLLASDGEVTKTDFHSKNDNNAQVSVHGEDGLLVDIACGIDNDHQDVAANALIDLRPADGLPGDEHPLFECDICVKRFRSKNGLLIHQNVHNRFSCNWCGRLFRMKQRAADHLAEVHSDRPMDISVVSPWSSSSKEESNAKNVMTRQIPTCSQCTEEYKTRDHLDRHVAACHTADGQETRDRQQRQQKQKTDDTGGGKIQNAFKAKNIPRPRVICTYCGVSVPKNYIQSHTNRHTGERPYKCNVCPKTFTSSINLSVHRDVHTSTSFLCPLCGRMFNTRATLRTHKRKICHKRMGLKADEEEEEKEEGKNC